MKKVLVIFGGKSSEHEVSLVSASNVIENIDIKKYEVHMVLIDKQGNWIKYNGTVENIRENKCNKDSKNERVENVFEYIKTFDTCFPVLHGKYGEDGSIQGLFEMAGVNYVGCDVIASAISIEKSIAKKIVMLENIPVVQYHNILKSEYRDNIDLKFDFPVIVKPCKEGSSYGVTKVDSKEEINKAILSAFKYDEHILIEKYINAREIECAVLGNSEYIVSNLGEILSENTVYDFDSKYNSNISRTELNVEIDKEQEKNIKEYAKKIAKVLGVKGLSRIDFFVDKDNNDIYFNEINTMPGFTSISMYPKLMENIGIPYNKLIEKLIELSFEKK